jgi:leucyl-tRNA---protein transferase
MRGFLVDCGPCPYLPGRRFHAFHPEPDPPALPYRMLMDHRFRRNGPMLYAPMCPDCQACQPVRVDVQVFVPRRDQRRCWKRNADLTVTWHPRGRDAERNALYLRYQEAVHEKQIDPEAGDFLAEDGGIAGGELHARDGQGQLVAVSVCDLFSDALSSVYCYYDPALMHRGLGTFMALAEIAFCREHSLRWLYLGFLVRGSPKMAYKARFLPQEVLEDGKWVRYGEGSTSGLPDF